MVVYGRYKQVCESVTKSVTTKKVWLPERQTEDKFIPMYRYASQVTKYELSEDNNARRAATITK